MTETSSYTDSAKEAAGKMGDTLHGWGEGIKDWWNNFSKDISWKDAAGMGGVALIGWVVGNMFGGGGVLGLAIASVLTVGMLTANGGQIGKDLGRAVFGDSARNDTGPSPVIEPTVARIQQPDVALPPDERTKAAARDVVQGADFRAPVVDSTYVPPRDTQRLVARS